MAQCNSTRKLIVVHRDLSNLRSGGAFYLARTIDYFRQQNIGMEVIDLGGFQTKDLRSRVRLVVYLIKRYLHYGNSVFHFTNHNLYFYLLIPYFVNRVKGNKYACACHLAQYPTRRNVFMKCLEFLFEYVFLQGASLLVIPSKAALQQFGIFHVDHKKKCIINPAPNVRHQGRPVFRRDCRNMIFVGNITPRKGLDVLIKAMEQLGDLNLHLDVAGNYDRKTAYYIDLERMITAAGLGERISFHGFLQPAQLDELYRNADVCVFPSRHETYGMVLVEAMSFGLPIVASAIPTTSEIVKDGVNGLLYEAASPAALAAALRKLCTAYNLRQKIVRNNIVAAKNARTWESVGEENFRTVMPFIHH